MRFTRRRRRAPLQTLAEIEAAFITLRDHAPDLPGAVAAGFASASLLPAGTLHAAALTLARAVTADDAGAAALAYHSPHHFAETVRAMGLLCGPAIAANLVTPTQASLGIIAMVGHDWGHDGTPGGDGRLEGEAVARVQGVLDRFAEADHAVLRAVILGTDPAQSALNAARALGQSAPGPLGPQIDRLCHLANEADVFASLLPNLAWQQSAALANEWRGHPRAAVVASFAGRLQFLRLYARCSLPAVQLGVARLVEVQVTAFHRAAHMRGAGDTPEAGAAALDAMARPDAMALYTNLVAEG